MTESEAIGRLKCIRLYMEINDRHSDSKFLDEDYEANAMAIHALEKQIPKKPIIHTNDKGRLACCPVCDSNVDWTYEGFWRKGNPKYCRECGQAIDWSE